MDSLLTGMYLLLSAVVPDDLANHLTSVGHKTFRSPDRIRLMWALNRCNHLKEHAQKNHEHYE